MPSPSLRRFSRQELLPEVGVEGQVRLAEARFAPDVDLGPEASAAAELYANACGLGRAMGGSARGSDQERAETAAVDVSAFFRHAAPRALGRGASAALSCAGRVLFHAPRVES